VRQQLAFDHLQCIIPEGVQLVICHVAELIGSGFLTGQLAIDVSKAVRGVPSLKDNIGVLLIQRALSTL
jgi:hypothetical protein